MPSRYHLQLEMCIRDSGNTLYTSCRERGADTSPEDRRELKAHDTIQDTTRLLGIYKVFVERAWVLYGVLYGALGNLVDCDTVCLLVL